MPMRAFDTDDSEETRMSLLRKLENPLAFIGESRLSHVSFNGAWMGTDEIIEMGKKSGRKKDEVLGILRERLDEILDQMREYHLSHGEAVTLFEEGIAVKRAIYILSNNVTDEVDRNDEMKRWLKYGRSIS